MHLIDFNTFNMQSKLFIVQTIKRLLFKKFNV